MICVLPEGAQLGGDAVVGVFDDALACGLGVGDDGVVVDGADDRYALGVAGLLDAGGEVGVDVVLVDADGGRDAYLFGELGDAFEVVEAADGGFGDNQGEGGASEAGDDRAADAGGAVDDDEVEVLLSGELGGLLAYDGDELAGVFGGDGELCVDELAVACGGDEPVAAVCFGKVDGVEGAHLDADAAAFAGDGVDG